jgi:hypothetical protein
MGQRWRFPACPLLINEVVSPEIKGIEWRKLERIALTTSLIIYSYNSPTFSNQKRQFRPIFAHFRTLLKIAPLHALLLLRSQPRIGIPLLNASPPRRPSSGSPHPYDTKSRTFPFPNPHKPASHHNRPTKIFISYLREL